MAKTLMTAKRMYQTFFPAVENPMSQGSLWINGAADGTDWCNFRTTANLAFGTQADHAVPPYDDSTALMKWSVADQGVEAIIYVGSTTNNCNSEVALRLRSSISAHVCNGYEVLFNTTALNQYMDIVRWNGALDSFDILVHETSVSNVQNGNIIKATVIGTVIRAYVNGVQKMSYDTVNDGTKFATGRPGLGCYLHNFGNPTGNNADFGFKFARMYEL